MVKIRLARIGRKKRPFYRILVSDARAPRDSGFIERIGYYDPLPKTPVVQLDVWKALEWLSKGAQPTDTVRSLLARQGVMMLFDMKQRKAAAAELEAAYEAWVEKHPDRFGVVLETEVSET